MDIEELSNYLNTEESKKVFKLLDRVIKSYGGDMLYQNMYLQSGCDFDYYFSPASNTNGLDIPESIKVYLENLFEKISEMDFINDIECDENYSNIDITFSTTKKSLSCNVDTYYISTRDYTESDEITDPEMIEVLKDWADRGYDEIKVDFSGGGDNGYIESNGYVDGGNSNIQIPASYEDFMYRMLQSYFGGWENNEGGQGTFTISINSNVIQLYMGLNEETPEGEEIFDIKIDY